MFRTRIYLKGQKDPIADLEAPRMHAGEMIGLPHTRQLLMVRQVAMVETPNGWQQRLRVEDPLTESTESEGFAEP